jgi:hypothetical protein
MEKMINTSTCQFMPTKNAMILMRGKMHTMKGEIFIRKLISLLQFTVIYSKNTSYIYLLIYFQGERVSPGIWSAGRN